MVNVTVIPSEFDITDVTCDNSTLENTGSLIRAKDLGITNAKLAGSIANAKLAGSITSDKLNFGVWEKVAETALTSEGTTFIFSSLDLDRDRVYKLIFNLRNASANNNRVRIFFNENTTIANYYFQLHETDSTINQSSRTNDTELCFCGNTIGKAMTGFAIVMHDYAGATPTHRCDSFYQRGLAVAVCTQEDHTASIFNGNVTRIDIVGTYNLQIGSRIILMKMSQ